MSCEVECLFTMNTRTIKIYLVTDQKQNYRLTKHYLHAQDIVIA